MIAVGTLVASFQGKARQGKATLLCLESSRLQATIYLMHLQPTNMVQQCVGVEVRVGVGVEAEAEAVPHQSGKHIL